MDCSLATLSYHPLLGVSEKKKNIEFKRAVASTILLVLEEGYGYYMVIGWSLYGYWMMDLEVAHRIDGLTIISEGNTAVFASLNLGQGCLPVLLPSGTLRRKIKRGLLENPSFIDDDLHDESHCQRKTACLMRTTSPI